MDTMRKKRWQGTRLSASGWKVRRVEVRWLARRETGTNGRCKRKEMMEQQSGEVRVVKEL